MLGTRKSAKQGPQKVLEKIGDSGDSRLDWFKQVRPQYGKASTLGSAGWFFQAAVRATCFEQPFDDDIVPLARGLKTILAKLGEDSRKSCGDSLLTAIKSSPIITPEDLLALPPQIYLPLLAFLAHSDNFSPLAASGLHPTTVEELYVHEMLLWDGTRDGAREFFDSCRRMPFRNVAQKSVADIANERIISFQGRKSAFAHGMVANPAELGLPARGNTGYSPIFTDKMRKHQLAVYPPSQLILSVDISLPMSVLSNLFGACVETERSARRLPAQNIVKQSEPKNWIAKGVLPFIDLRIWAAVEGVEIAPSTLADLIFNDGTYDVDVVRKTTSKMAEKMMTTTGQLFNRLHASAAIDPTREKWTLPMAHLKKRKK